MKFESLNLYQLYIIFFCENHRFKSVSCEVENVGVVSIIFLGFVRARGGGDIRDVNTNSENWAVVKAALVAGMYPHLVHVDRENVVLAGPKEKKVRFHPTSVLSQPQYKKVKLFECFLVLR